MIARRITPLIRHELRDYQSAAVDRVAESLANRPILVAPTGAGKTVMAVALVERLAVPTLWLAHRKELITQAAEQLAGYGLTTGVIMPGFPRFPLAQVQVASVATMIRRLDDRPHACLIVIDECHHATADSYRQILNSYCSAAVVGLTATPFRLDGQGLGDLFGQIVVSAWTDELCDAGVLHRPRVYSTLSPPDLRGVKVERGDYNTRQLEGRVNTADQNADVVRMWKRHAGGRRTVCFAVDIEHSQAIVAAFKASGIAAEHLDGNCTPRERDAILARLRSGKTMIVSNCMVLTEGWDLPALQCAIIARPTASLNLHFQMIGRIMRACPGKDGAIVLDHAGNHHVHGLVTRRLEYSLDGTAKVGSSEPLGLRRCRACGLFFELTIFACPECGWTPQRAEAAERKRLEIHGDGELAEFSDTDINYRRSMWNLFEAEREASGYKPGWSFFRFKERFGVDPVIVNGELIDPATATVEQKRAVYEQFLATALDKGFATGWASHRYRDIFGCWPKGFVTDSKQQQLRARWSARQEAAV